MWPNERLLQLFGVERPVVQAPMAGASGPDIAIAVAEAGGLGSLPCAMLTPEAARAELGIIRQRTGRPINVNFFCHVPQPYDGQREAAWRERLQPYFQELGVEPPSPGEGPQRTPFDEAMCALVEEARPEVVSFHFGLPERSLLDRVKATGAKVIASATTAAEATWLEEAGCDAVIAQGYEAGGHSSLFLRDDITSLTGTMALVPQVVDAVRVPVIAAGGITDPRGIAAAFMLGAAGVQIGTAYLFCPESLIAPPHRAALANAKDGETVLTNVFTGRPARGLLNRFVREVGPMSPLAPAFPGAAGASAPLRARAAESGLPDFLPLWAGQAVTLGRAEPAGALTRRLADEALELLGKAARPG